MSGGNVLLIIKVSYDEAERGTRRGITIEVLSFGLLRVQHVGFQEEGISVLIIVDHLQIGFACMCMFLLNQEIETAIFIHIYKRDKVSS